MKFFRKYLEFDTINSKFISNVDLAYSLKYLLFKIFKNGGYQSYSFFSSPKCNSLIGQKWLFSFLFSIIIIFLNPVFGQTETKTPLMPSSGGVGSTNEGTGSVEMTFGQVIYQNEGNKDFMANQGIQQPFVNELNSKVDLLSCDDILLDNKIIYSDELYQGVIILPYKTGNGAYYLGFNLPSEQVGGLTMSLLPGKLNKGNGSLELEIKGLPDKVGEAIFPLKFGTKECKISLSVKSLPPLVSSLDCDNIVLNPKVIGSKIDYSGELRINYSFRKNTVNQNKKIWHIHGEINNGIKRINRYSAESIMIGNEHYGDYFRKIHEYIKPPGGNVIDGLNREPESWIQKFFTHDIHIIGFSLDFSETHLWWLLNLRARIIESINITIANKIYFYYPSFEQEQYGPKIQLLEAIHVNCIMIPIDENNEFNRYIDYWNIILNHHLNHLNA